MVRSRADAIGMHHGEYIASVLAERLGYPYWAAPEVRATEGGLYAMLSAATPEPYAPSPESWTERDLFVTKPVKALGEIVRDHAKREGSTLTKVITDELALFHGLDLDAHTFAVVADDDPLGVNRDIRLKQEVQRLLA